MSRIMHVSLVQMLAVLLGVGVAVSSTSVLAASAEKTNAPVQGAAKEKDSLKPEIAQDDPVFARVNGKPVTVSEFQGMLAEIMRKRYYHGTVPENEARALNKEVSELVINRVLLVDEAERRGIKPDPAKFDETLAYLDKRYADEPAWDEKREELLPQIKLNMDRQSKVEQLEKMVRDLPQPTPAEVRAYYDKRPDLFTEPEKLRISVILLKVDPGATKDDWELAVDQAHKIYDRIKGGADFAEQARQYSQHDSAENGGDIGYLHGGMLPEGIEEKIVAYQVGVLNEPINTLEGVLISRVESRIPPALSEFNKVEKRAQDLLIRDRAEEAWQNTISRLRAGAKIEILMPQIAGDN